LTFDPPFRLEKLTQKNDLLEKLSDRIDFEYFRKTLSVLRDADTAPSKGDMPGYGEVLIFQIHIQQHRTNISDNNTDFAILDRLGFMRLL
jgi:hypothetical protein